jgi:hypothetical protein
MVVTGSYLRWERIVIALCLMDLTWFVLAFMMHPHWATVAQLRGADDAIRTRPPRGMKESCMLFTAPQLASVVTVAKSAELAMPKRTSLPSMLPPDCSGDTC